MNRMSFAPYRNFTPRCTMTCEPRGFLLQGIGALCYPDQSSAHRLLHERVDRCLFGGRQLLQREGDRPQGAFVEVCRVAETDRRIPGFELLRALEEADDVAVLGIRGHPVPEPRREGWRAGSDDGVEPHGH